VSPTDIQRPGAQPNGSGETGPVTNLPPAATYPPEAGDPLLGEITFRLSDLGERVIALVGQGAVGPASPAVRYASQHAREYRVCWWLRAHDPVLLSEDWRSLAAEVGLPANADLLRAVPELRGWLEDERHGPWLLVLDGAPAPEEVAPYVPKGGPGRVLVTATTPGWEQLASSTPMRMDSPGARRPGNGIGPVTRPPLIAAGDGGTAPGQPVLGRPGHGGTAAPAPAPPNGFGVARAPGPPDPFLSPPPPGQPVVQPPPGPGPPPGWAPAPGSPPPGGPAGWPADDPAFGAPPPGPPSHGGPRPPAGPPLGGLAPPTPPAPSMPDSPSSGRQLPRRVPGRHEPAQPARNEPIFDELARQNPIHPEPAGGQPASGPPIPSRPILDEPLDLEPARPEPLIDRPPVNREPGEGGPLGPGPRQPGPVPPGRFHPPPVPLGPAPPGPVQPGPVPPGATASWPAPPGPVPPGQVPPGATASRPVHPGPVPSGAAPPGWPPPGPVPAEPYGPVTGWPGPAGATASGSGRQEVLHWDQALKRLRRASPQAAALLQLAAFLDSEAIPVGLLALTGAVLPGELGASLRDPRVFHNALATLAQLGMVAHSGDRLAVPPLAQVAVGSALGGEGARSWAAYALRVLGLVLALPTRGGERPLWAEPSRLLPHAEAVARHALALGLRTPELPTVLSEIGVHLVRMRRPDLAVPYLDRALQIAREMHGLKHREVVRALNHLALAHQLLGDEGRANQLHNEAMAIGRSLDSRLLHDRPQHPGPP